MHDAIVVITGASSGIGAAVAEEVGRRGALPVVVARRTEALVQVASRSSARAMAVEADMTSRAEVRRVVDAVLDQHGRIDVWINNVGRGITRAPSELTDQDLDEIMRVNVNTALYGMQETLPHFKARERGHVINVSSMLGRMPFATYRSAYCAAKHFLNALTITFRAEVQATHPDIQYSLVSPGVVRTEFGVNALHGGPDSRQIPESQSAEEVALVIAGVIDSRRPDVYTRPGAARRIADYYASIGEDPAAG
jgi:NAD(P)-dependent dehydrogenase (short-subunit alcohol dehydrogenase family)